MQVRNKTFPEVVFTIFRINISFTPYVSLRTNHQLFPSWLRLRLGSSAAALRLSPPVSEPLEFCARSPHIRKWNNSDKDYYRPTREAPTLSIVFLHICCTACLLSDIHQHFRSFTTIRDLYSRCYFIIAFHVKTKIMLHARLKRESALSNEHLVDEVQDLTIHLSHEVTPGNR